MRVKISVTKKDIDEGWDRGGSQDCPIAIALKRKTAEGFDVFNSEIIYGLKHKTKTIPLPPKAAIFSDKQCRYDSKKMKPFSFYLDLPKKDLI